MGFWSSVGSAFSSACSAVGSAFSSACSAAYNAVSSVCSAVGSAVSNAFTGVMNSISSATNLVSSIAPVLTVLALVIPQLRATTTAVAVIDAILQAFGLAEQGQKVEDLGQDILDAYEVNIKPADYSTYDEYMAAIRAFKLENPDREKGEYNFSEKYVAGLSTQSWGLEEKFGAGTSGLVVSILKDAPNLEKGEGYFTAERVDKWVSGVSSIADVAKYFNGKLNVDEKNRVEQELVKVEQQQNPDKSINMIYEELDKHRDDH